MVGLVRRSIPGDLGGLETPVKAVIAGPEPADPDEAAGLLQVVLERRLRDRVVHEQELDDALPGPDQREALLHALAATAPAVGGDEPPLVLDLIAGDREPDPLHHHDPGLEVLGPSRALLLGHLDAQELGGLRDAVL